MDDREKFDPTSETSTLAQTIIKIPKLINKDDVSRMIDLQMGAIDRLEGTNKNLINCSTMAQNKLASTSKLFKKTAKEMSDSKKDLDIIYRKISELKNRMKAEKLNLVDRVDYIDNQEKPADIDKA